jgi:glycosyltransferase involved in cell wall biosynthesis
MSDERLTVIIPCLNEAGNVAATVDDVLAVAPTLPMPVEILLVDDGSKDGTPEVMHRLAAQHEPVRVRINPRNLGLGRSVMNAYGDVAPGSWVTVIPGDNEFLFASIRNFMAMRRDYDLILGFFQNPVIRTLKRRGASVAFTSLVNQLYGFSFRYYNGMKMYRVETMMGIPVISSGFAYNAELIAKTVLRDPLLRVGEAPFAASGRSQGDSKAISATGMSRAVRELMAGYRSVTRYREQIIREADQPMVRREDS